MLISRWNTLCTTEEYANYEALGEIPFNDAIPAVSLSTMRKNSGRIQEQCPSFKRERALQENYFQCESSGNTESPDPPILSTSPWSCVLILLVVHSSSVAIVECIAEGDHRPPRVTRCIWESSVVQGVLAQNSSKPSEHTSVCNLACR